MGVLIPLWYYQFGSIIYAIAACVGAMLSYYSYKLYDIGSKRNLMFFHFGFIFITAGLAAMAFANIYGYINFMSCQSICQFDFVNFTYSAIKIANYGYYLTTIIGYALIALSYLGAQRKFILPLVQIIGINNSTLILFPFLNSYFQIFQILSVAVISYIAFKTIRNYNSSKTKSSLYVMLGFVFIGLYHVLMLLLPFSRAFFAFAHFALLLGFGSLLYVLIQVNKSERT